MSTVGRMKRAPHPPIPDDVGHPRRGREKLLTVIAMPLVGVIAVCVLALLVYGVSLY